ncbi:4a-hydroxytetrahydrobiopterin dehydratase [Paenibacillus lutrae]|uniref:4a-hydroxytetrahydrobiopterin dehydratase n=1 Tax=Paenibacillus lutrae TaxID=2078573 RepID=A0A7X3FMV6_9BACL|nr:4a-hydroxytetrahydrobiopterin dehydratase [Paenibacillus lutrae]MVP02550.1 4a-hydroxytetrahydrobiopterin dehydratase [Paenibacillus lutrae]
MASADKLSHDQIAVKLAGLNGWNLRDERTIEKTYECGNFRNAIDFVSRVADVAESLEHHPLIKVDGKRVTMQLSTHDVSGLSDMDFTSAVQYDGVLPARG